MDKEKTGIAALVISLINLLINASTFVVYLFYAEVVKDRGGIKIPDLTLLESNAAICGITTGVCVFVLGLLLLIAILPLILGIIAWHESTPAKIAVILDLIPIAIPVFLIILICLIFCSLGSSSPQYVYERRYY